MVPAGSMEDVMAKPDAVFDRQRLLLRRSRDNACTLCRPNRGENSHKRKPRPDVGKNKRRGGR